MLDLSAVATHLKSIGQSAIASRSHASSQLGTARALANVDNEVWCANIDAINGAVGKRQTALILGDRPISTSIASPTPPEFYTAIAVDGSQIPLDRHAAFPYYLINIGHVVIHYGTGERPTLLAHPTLFYNEEDLTTQNSEQEQTFVTETQIALRRTSFELSKATQLIAEADGRQNVIVCVDGPLVLWAQDPANSLRRIKPAIKELCTAIEASKAYNTLFVGYISRSGSRDVVNTLAEFQRILMGTPDEVTGTMDRLTDSILFSALLEPGERSILFQSKAKVLQSYEEPSGRIGFYYLNTGAEIARVEIPLIKEDLDAWVDLTHALLLDQIQKGLGYPVALMEAHEQAVVRASERNAVDQLILNELIRSGVPAFMTRKALAKRTRPI